MMLSLNTLTLNLKHGSSGSILEMGFGIKRENNMDSKEAKRLIVYDLVMRRNHLLAVTEGINNSDVLAINNNFYTTEYEIKVSKADLLGEFKAIKAAINGEQDLSCSSTKFWKHCLYLGTREKYKNYANLDYFKPNRFFFAVPKELKDLAVQCVAGTPYGVKYITPYGMLEEVTAVKIHNERAEMSYVIRIIKRVMVENINLRGK